MKRPILVVTIGYIIGIILGLYLKSLALFCVFLSVLIFIFFIIKSSFISVRRYLRYIKLILNFKVIILILISSTIGYKYTTKINYKYEETYNVMQKQESLETEGVVISNKKESKYKNIYKIKINNKKFYCYMNKNEELEIGDKIKIKGKYQKPSNQRNFGGFDYSNYLKTKFIYGVIQVDKVELVNKNQINPVFKLVNKIQQKIIENSNKIKGKENQSIYLGLVLGNTENISEELEEDFKTAGILHILAVSGMHMSYLILGSTFVFKKTFGKRIANILVCILIIFYMMITGFSSSIVRSGIMAILFLMSKIFYRKNDTSTSISISLLIMLIYNPNLITDVGLQLSYGGTIGIVLFRKPVLILLSKLTKRKNKLEEIISVILSAQISILPISLYHFNLFSSYFIITNLLVTLIVGPVFIISIVYTIFSFINSYISSVLIYLLQIGIKIIIIITKIPKYLIGSKIYFPTPEKYQIILYYLVIAMLFYLFMIKNNYRRNMSQERVLNLIALFKYKYRQINKSKIQISLLMIILIYVLVIFIPKDLKINFVDVGQGDSTFIITPHNKTILIDGGGNKEFDIGKNVLLPYVLDRGYSKIDFIIISHFDEDHVGGILTILKEIKVGKVIIAKQLEKCEQYEKFLETIKSKNIKVEIVKNGDKIEIEKDMYFKILWPTEKPILENAINNNAIVAKLIYKDFTCLFTGDIENIAEKELVKEKDLKSTVLKVAHHGSKSSSTKEFLDKVKPKVALIGVGENNKYGHPNDEVIKRIKEFTNKIYRTDLNGEISINIDNKKGVLKSIKCKY